MIPRRKQAPSLLLVCIALVASCRSQNGAPATNSPTTDTIVSATPPFQTKEPERYRATRTITEVTTDGRTRTIQYAIAKDGEFRRFEADFVSGRLVFVQGPQGKFVLLPAAKVYMDQAEGLSSGVLDEYESSPERLLHTESGKSSYKKLGNEIISGRNTNKYLVVVNASNAGNVSSSETLIWIDEALGMPIRSETKSSDGSSSTIELSDLALEVDKTLFQIPGDYKKVPSTEIDKYRAPH
jgi:outer membrane lipoprotein-sorting protein